MSKVTASSAKRFVTAYNSSTKSSVAMVDACVSILLDDTKGAALVAAVRGAVESVNGPFITPKATKDFERLVSQRSFAASLVITLGDGAMTDPVAIKAALSVASGALPRKASEDIADRFKGTDDALGFADAIKAALIAHKAAPRTQRATKAEKGTESGTPAETTEREVSPREAFRTGLALIESALKETDDKDRPAMVKALKALLLRNTQPVRPASTVTTPAPTKAAPKLTKAAQKAAILAALASGESGATITAVAAEVSA